MKYGSFDQDYIMQYLQSYSDLDSFYIFCVNGAEPGLIHYFDIEGESWCLMEEDNELVDACLEFLRTRNVKKFSDVDTLKVFEADRSKINQ